jgi:hypothetical protein
MRSMVAPSASKVTASSAATAADFPEGGKHSGDVGITEAEKIKITPRTMRIVEPPCHQYGTFEDEALTMRADA